MKYIIDMPNQDYSYDEIFHTLKLKFYDDNLSREVSLDAKPYTEPNCKAIETEVWDLARAVNDMRYDDFVSCFGGKTEEMVYELSYSEVKAAYEAWKRTKEEICVGDEIEAETGKKACVLYTNPDGTQLFVFKADGMFAWWSKCAIHKTGKNYSEIAELLKKMRDAE